MTDTPTEHGWHVDDRCTNCDVARRLAPGLIAEEGGRSVVVRRPRDAEDERRLHAAAFACHTRSVRPPSARRPAAVRPPSGRRPAAGPTRTRCRSTPPCTSADTTRR
ncbi:ferredoxin [Streptomyces niveus]|uniref:ferredoxin n=1 Tax=Streptomyces niveus TaxID=193462 RepID=UPI0034354E79